MNAAFPKKLVVGLLLAVFVVPHTAQADEAVSDFSLGVNFYRKARYKLAAETFDLFLKENAQHPRAPLARLYFGLSLHSLEKYEDARREFIEFIKNNPQSTHLPDARYRAAESSFYLADYPAAVTQLSAYLEAHKGHNLNGWATVFLGGSLNGTGKYAEAESVLRQLIESGPEAQLLPEAEFELGRAIEGQKKTDEALKVFEELALQKTGIFSARSLAHIGTIHFEQRDYAKASVAYDAIVADYAKEPIAVSAALQSGAARFSLGQFDEALKRLEFVPETSSKANEARVLKGLCLRELGRLPEARKLLEDAYVKAKDTSQAAEILFRRAELERLDGKRELAAQMFVDLADRWPADGRVAESLFNAAEAKMESADPDGARRLITRLNNQFPDDAESADIGILKGRLLLVDNEPEEAVEVLKAANASPNLSPTRKLLGTYHLIRAFYRSGNFEDVLTTFEPMREEFLRPTATGTSQAISLAALSCLELQQFQKAQQLATLFLDRSENAGRKTDALAARAVASANLKQFAETKADLDVLVAEQSKSAQTWRAVVQSGEAAWRLKEYVAAAEIYGIAAAHPENAKVHESGLAGLGWSKFELGKFGDATAAFQKLVDAYPQSSGRTEAEYMVGFCLQKANRQAQAAGVFLQLFNRLDSIVAGDVDHPDYRFAFDSARGYARLAGANDDTASANKVYRQMTTSFASADNLDSIYDEWAYLNYQANDFTQSDSIYKQLVAKFPTSKFTGNARLSLAESDMVANRLTAALKEFKAISREESYEDLVKEVAMSHAIDLLAGGRQWGEVLELSRIFADRYGASDRAPRVQLFFAEALLDQKQLKEADRNVSLLMNGVKDELISAEPWTDRIWVVAADIALAEKRYADIDPIADDLAARKTNSSIAFQLKQIQGLRWKTQAEPDFVRAREYFKQVTQDEFGKGTETAARCQFLIAETFLLENELKLAVREYFRVYSYPYPDWQGKALYQMAMCEQNLGDTKAAVRTLTDLLNEFPNHELEASARARLAEFRSGP